jgi:hypothetical protein
MNIGHSNKTQHILFYDKRKMRIAVYSLQWDRRCLVEEWAFKFCRYIIETFFRLLFNKQDFHV